MKLVKTEILICDEEEEISDILYNNCKIIIVGDEVLKNEFNREGG